ncbi:response regulator [Algicella marina]|uniref:Response regulator n=1 Tax=Algicella marina TaxID=2683284 RepID=A0A6P1T4K7_9RHOB|nr:response regulator [Algicella marina]QHQ35472.1 response regulator [Algicella marina]
MQNAQVREIRPACTPFAPRRILVVEDDRHDQERIRRLFRYLTTEVILDFATAIADARQRLQKVPPQAIVLDNGLPDGLGIDLALELSRSPASAETPTFIISDWPSPFMHEKAEAAGVHAVFCKSEFGARQAFEILRRMNCSDLQLARSVRQKEKRPTQASVISREWAGPES